MPSLPHSVKSRASRSAAFPGLIQTTRQFDGSFGLAAVGAEFGSFPGHAALTVQGIINSLTAVFMLMGFAAARKWMQSGK